MITFIKNLLKAIIISFLTFLLAEYYLIRSVIELNQPIILVVRINIILIPTIIIGLGILFFYLKKKYYFWSTKKTYNCTECGASFRLEDQFCPMCGKENVYRKDSLEKLEKLEAEAEHAKTKRSERLESSKPKKSYRAKKFDETEGERLFQVESKIKLRKTELLIGGSFEKKLEWVRKQYFEINKSIQQIADELGESMITVKRYLDELENRRKNNNKQEK